MACKLYCTFSIATVLCGVYMLMLHVLCPLIRLAGTA